MIDPKTIRSFFIKFIPSKEVSIICILFYILGIVFAFMNPEQAHLTFSGGMFLENIEAKIKIPADITANYMFNQFIYYLGPVSLNIFLNNLFLMILCIFSGIAIIPVILADLFMKMGTITFFIVEKMGLNGIAVFFGSFHIYFEFWAALLAIESFFKFYISFFKALSDKDISIFKNCIVKDFLPLIFIISILLAIAAILEVFWSTWWGYVFTHPYISWYDFYFGVYSVLLM